MVGSISMKKSITKKIVILIMCFGLVIGGIGAKKVEGAGVVTAITVTVIAVKGAAGVGATVSTFMPYVTLAVAMIGTGSVAYNNADEITAVAQHLYSESSVVMKSLIAAAYDVGNDVLIMTDAIRNFIIEKALQLQAMLDTPDPVLQSITIDTSYEDIPALFDSVPIENISENHIYGDYNSYFAFNIAGKVYYMTGLTVLSSFNEIVPEAIFEVAEKQGYVNFEGVTGLRASKPRTSANVDIHVFEYDPVNSTFTKIEMRDLDDVGTSRTFNFENGLGLRVGRTTPTNSTISDIRSITLTGIENVYSLDGLTSVQDFENVLVNGGFGVLPQPRVFTGDYSPGKEVSVPVGDILVNPGLNADEMADGLVTAFPTQSGAIHLDRDKGITGVGAKELPGVLVDSGVKATPTTIPGVNATEIDNVKAQTNTAIESALPRVFPMAQTALVGLENVREEPPVIKVNLNEIFDASVSEVSPELDSPFDEGESVFFDFNDFNEYDFRGTPLIEYIRMIIGFGFIFSTFLYIWKKFTVSNS